MVQNSQNYVFTMLSFAVWLPVNDDTLLQDTSQLFVGMLAQNLLETHHTVEACLNNPPRKLLIFFFSFKKHITKYRLLAVYHEP